MHSLHKPHPTTTNYNTQTRRVDWFRFRWHQSGSQEAWSWLRSSSSSGWWFFSNEEMALSFRKYPSPSLQNLSIRHRGLNCLMILVVPLLNWMWILLQMIWMILTGPVKKVWPKEVSKSMTSCWSWKFDAGTRSSFNWAISSLALWRAFLRIAIRSAAKVFRVATASKILGG